MIKLLKRNEINEDKYNACIEKSIQSSIYAFSWYLDEVTTSWAVFVLNNYEAVMPIPYVRSKRYLYQKKIMQPLFCQQLGIFSENELLIEYYHKFVTQFLLLKPKTYQFNTQNTSFLNTVDFSRVVKINYELSLQKSFEEIKKKYSKNIKRNIKKAKKHSLIVKEISINKLLKMMQKTVGFGLQKKHYLRLEKLLVQLIEKMKGKVYGVFLEENLIASAFFIFHQQKIIHLISSSLPQGKEFGAISFLFNFLIKEQILTKNIFDFEGSMIPGIARFYSGFGAEKEIYYQVEG